MIEGGLAGRFEEHLALAAVKRTPNTRRTFATRSRACLPPSDIVEVFYRVKLVETMPRVVGKADHRIDYRHFIWSLVRKPGAFARFRFRAEMFARKP